MYGEGYVIGFFSGLIEGATENLGGPGFGDIAEANNNSLQSTFNNLGDNKYRITSEEGRKTVIYDLKKYLGRISEDRDHEISKITSYIKSQEEYIKLLGNYVSIFGASCDPRYKDAIGSINKSKAQIKFYKNYIDDINANYQKYIDDANTIININMQ